MVLCGDGNRSNWTCFLCLIHRVSRKTLALSSVLLFMNLIGIANNDRKIVVDRRDEAYTHVGCPPFFVAYLLPSSAQ